MVLRERSSIGAGETERGGVRVFDFWGFQVMASPSRAVPLPPATHSVKRTCLDFGESVRENYANHTYMYCACVIF